MNYISQYPPVQSDTYIKATSEYDASNFHPYFATDPALSLTGSYVGCSWISAGTQIINQRFHIDLGSAKVIKRIYYENQMYGPDGQADPYLTTYGVYHFTLWGSNSATAFADLVYGDDTDWTQLTIAQSTFDQHVDADQVDPKYILVTNSIAYRYYAFKIADNHGGATWMGVRRFELQSLEGWIHTIMGVNTPASIMGIANDGTIKTVLGIT